MTAKSPEQNLLSYSDRLLSGQVTPETLIKEREMLLDLYKHHLKLLLEANVFIYAVTGAIGSFVSLHTSIPDIRWILLLPAAVCVVFAALFIIVSSGFGNTDSELNKIAEGLNTNTVSIINALPVALRFSAGLLIVIAGLLLAGFMRFPHLNDAVLPQRFAVTTDNSVALDMQTGQLCNTVPRSFDFSSIGGKRVEPPIEGLPPGSIVVPIPGKAASVDLSAGLIPKPKTQLPFCAELPKGQR